MVVGLSCFLPSPRRLTRPDYPNPLLLGFSAKLIPDVLLFCKRLYEGQALGQGGNTVGSKKQGWGLEGSRKDPASVSRGLSTHHGGGRPKPEV